jgi:TetR/AcrR family transcriptional repressor of nem operon
MPQRSAREDLVEAGSRVFLSKGFHAASVNDIVANAGVPKGSFYNHFESKDALALEVVKRYVASYDLSPLRAEEGSPLARLRASFASTVERTVARGVENGCLLGTFSSDFGTYGDEVREYVATALAHWGKAVADCLVAAKKAGELPAQIDPRTFGAYLVDAYEGAVARAKVSHRREPLDAFLATTFDVLLPTKAEKRRR